jgi:arsenate reductase-like glutaredoxin family protein
MALKKVKYITYDEHEQCADIRNLIENAGIVLEIRDLSKEPLTEEEVARLISHFEIGHFLNPMSKSYKDLGFDKHTPSRDEIIKGIAGDYTLLRRPIIKNARLFTIGCNKKAISDMLQISRNGHNSDNGDGNYNAKNGKHESVGSARK